MPESQGVQLQRLRDFTVQIRDPVRDAIVGTGIIVAARGEVITCAHVARAALNVKELAEGLEVGVYLPWAQASTRQRRARVTGVFSGFDDDVVLLRISD